MEWGNTFHRHMPVRRGQKLMRLNRHKRGWEPMMSLTVLVSTLLPLPSPYLPPPSSCLSVSLLHCRHSEKAWEWQEEGEEEETEEERGGRRRRGRAAVRESEFSEFSHSILPFTTAGTLYSLFFSIPASCCSETSISSWNLQQEKHDYNS